MDFTWRNHYVGQKKQSGFQLQHVAWGQAPKCHVGIIDWLWKALMATCVAPNSKEPKQWK